MLRDAAGDFELRDPTYRVSILENHQKGKRKSRTLTGKELVEFLATMSKQEPRHYPMTVVAFLTGMRFSEYSALKWSDLQEDEEVILLQRSQYRGNVALTKNTETPGDPDGRTRPD